MKSALDGMDVLLMDPAEFVGPRKPQEEVKIGFVVCGFGGSLESALRTAVAYLHLHRISLETLPSPETIVFTTEEFRAQQVGKVFVVEDLRRDTQELIAHLTSLDMGPIPRGEIFILPREKESNLSRQITRYGPKGYKSGSQLRLAAARLPRSKRKR